MFTERLLQLRKDHHLTQDQLADHLGVDRTTYSNYERGIHEPDMDTLVRLSRFYGITSDYLLGISDQPTPPPALDADMRRLLDCYRGSDPRGRETIMDLALRESIRYNEPQS